MRLYFCSATLQIRGGTVTKRQAYSGVSAASIIIITKSDEDRTMVVLPGMWLKDPDGPFVKIILLPVTL